MRNIGRGLAGAALALTAVLSVPCVAFAATDTQSMYRLYNPNSGEHFYTSSTGERSNLIKAGWKNEGVGWTAPVKSDTPVYRLYNKNGSDHHYTTSKGERDMLVKAGWQSEGIGWYSDDDKGVPLYRQYNPNAKSGSHNYTTSEKENNNLVKAGWKAEGIGWYGVDTSNPYRNFEGEFVGTFEGTYSVVSKTCYGGKTYNPKVTAKNLDLKNNTVVLDISFIVHDHSALKNPEESAEGDRVAEVKNALVNLRPDKTGYYQILDYDMDAFNCVNRTGGGVEFLLCALADGNFGLRIQVSNSDFVDTYILKPAS